MSHLIKAEFLRLASRRLSWILLACLAAFATIVAIADSGSVRELSEQDHAEALEIYQSMVEQMQREGCSPEDTECMPRYEDFLREPLDYEAYMTNGTSGAIVVLVAVAALAAGLIGSEFTSGSIATQLTFTPRRVPVMLAKVVAATTGGFLLMFAYVATMMVMGTIMFLMLWGAGDVVASQDLPLLVARLLVTAFFVALLAAVLTFGLGSTGLTLAAGVLVLLVSEIMANFSTGSPHVWVPFLPSSNLYAMLEGTYSYHDWTSAEQMSPVLLVTFWQSVGYASVLVLLVAVASAFVFRRRDLLR